MKGPSDWPAWHDRLIALALPVAVAVFLIWPDLDLQLTRRVYAAGGGFIWRDLPLVTGLYRYTPWIGRGLMLLVFVYWLVGVLRGHWRHAAALTLCAALLGPGLLIEGVLKPVWQRPRPVQVVEFGGQHAYEPPFAYCADCHTHHSFVSSHAAAGFALLTLGLGASARWRRRWLLMGLVAGAVVGWGRVLQGGHFVSDIVFAFFTVWLAAQGVMWADRRRTPR